MGWLPIALLTGALVALRDALVKRGSARTDEYETIVVLSGTTALALLGVLLVTGMPAIGRGLPLAILGSAVPNVFAYLLLAKAVKHSDLSLVAPLLGLTPLFLLVTTPLILGERPHAVGVAGVLLIVLGAYLLNVQDFRHGPLGPFRALLRDPGARMMLGVAFLWSISSNYDKIGVDATSPLAWPVIVHSFVTLVLVPVVAWRRLRGAGEADESLHATTVSMDGVLPGWWSRNARRAPLVLVAAGMVNALQSFTHMTAITMTFVPYVVAVKRTSLLFSVGLGRVMFNERRIRQRALGAATILAGVLVFALG